MEKTNETPKHVTIAVSDGIYEYFIAREIGMLQQNLPHPKNERARVTRQASIVKRLDPKHIEELNDHIQRVEDAIISHQGHPELIEQRARLKEQLKRITENLKKYEGGLIKYFPVRN